MQTLTVMQQAEADLDSPHQEGTCAALREYVAIALEVTASQASDTVKSATVLGLLRPAGSSEFSKCFDVKGCLNMQAHLFIKPPPWPVVTANLRKLQQTLAALDAPEMCHSKKIVKSAVASPTPCAKRDTCKDTKTGESLECSVLTRSGGRAPLHEVAEAFQYALKAEANYSNRLNQEVENMDTPQNRQRRDEASNFDMLAQVLACRKFEKMDQRKKHQEQ
jgi:hypothetical protein